MPMHAIHPTSGDTITANVVGASLVLSPRYGESYSFDRAGRMTNPSFWDYKIYTAADLPEIVTILVDSFEQTGPFGAKSVGEIGINGPAPAIANAIYDAVGIRVYDLPITPQKVWELMREEGSV